MKGSLLFFVVLLSVAGVSAQATKTVTNADLEKFRQERLKNEKDYRENYAKWGMPSPEELQRRNEQSAKELTELSNRLRAERLEQERQEALAAQGQSGVYAVPIAQPRRYYQAPYYYGYPVYGGFYRGRVNRNYGGTPFYNNKPVVLSVPRFDFLPGSILPSRQRR